MKKPFHILFSALFFLATGGAIPPAIGYSQDPPPSACADADTFLREGAIDLAETAYKSLLENDPESACALLGLRKVAKKRCHVAKKIALSGDPEGAKAVYIAVLNAYPDLQCAVDGLRALPTKYDEVEALAKIGDYSKAWEKFEAAILSNPNDPRVESLRKRLWATSQSLVLKIQYGIATFGVLILVVIVIIIICCWLYHQLGFRLDVVGFDTGMVTLKESPDNDKKPESLLIALFEQALTKIAGETRTLRRSDLVDTPLEAPEFPASIQTLPKNLGALFTLITKLIPANVVEVKGTLQYDTQKGAGLYVKLVRSCTHKLWGSFTVWQNEIDLYHTPGKGHPDIDVFGRLVEFAAISTYWEIFRHRGLNLRRIFGTDDAGSYYTSNRLVSPRMEQILDKSFEKGKEEALRQEIVMLSRRALSQDRKNYAAYLNLGQALKKTEYIEYARSNTKPSNPIRISANYILGILETVKHIRAEKEDERAKHLASSISFLREAVKSARKSRKRRKTKISSDYIAMLTIPYAAVLCWSGTSKRECRKPKRMIEKIVREHHTSGRVLYNLACYFSTDFLFKGPSKESMDKAFKYLGESLDAMPGLVEHVKKDPTLAGLYREKAKEMETLIETYSKMEDCRC